MLAPSNQDQLEQALAELYALHELAKLLASTIELDQVVEYILDSLCGLIGTESSFLYEHEIETGALKLLGTQGPWLTLPHTITITASHWIAQAAMARDPVALPPTDDLTLAAASLRAHDVIQGVFGIGTPTRRQFTTKEMDRLGAVSHLAAMALESARLYAHLQTIAITDGLTGLYNYRHFFDELHREMGRARRHNIPLALLILDIDHFKDFNDTFGHVRGDEVLRTVARVLQENIRGSDLAARYGGEEFAVILVGAGTEQAQRVAERIRRCIAHFTFHGNSSITVSIGVASLDLDAETAEVPQSFAHRADLALYRAKQTGRDCVCVYGECTGENAGENIQNVGDMHESTY